MSLYTQYCSAVGAMIVMWSCAWCYFTFIAGTAWQLWCHNR